MEPHGRGGEDYAYDVEVAGEVRPGWEHEFLGGEGEGDAMLAFTERPSRPLWFLPPQAGLAAVVLAVLAARGILEEEQEILNFS